jgi:hypothetical protein
MWTVYLTYKISKKRLIRYLEDIIRGTEGKFYFGWLLFRSVPLEISYKETMM